MCKSRKNAGYASLYILYKNIVYVRRSGYSKNGFKYSKHINFDRIEKYFKRLKQ